MENQDEEEQIEEKVTKNLWKIVTIVVVSIICIMVIISILTIGHNNIYRGVRINGIKLGGLTEKVAEKTLENYYKGIGNIDVSLICGEESINFKGSDIMATFDSKAAAKYAFNIGRYDNFAKRLFYGIKFTFFSQNVDYDVNIDIKKLDKQIKLVSADVGNEVIQPSYVRQGNKLIINTGTPGIKIDHSAIKQKIVKELNSMRNTYVEIETIKVEPDKVDIDKIQSSIKKNVQNAEYISDTGVLVDQIIGIEIENVEEAKKIAESVTEEGMQFSIPLKITLPDTTIESVMEELFGDTLSTYTTTYNTSEVERSENVRLAAEAINEMILMPGQDFSYNNVVGERTTERGYKIAKVYQEGQVVDGLGGGICQVSSTLYNAAVKADLEILERKNHSLPVAYVKLGRDATVSYGSLDFKFRNSLQYPIKIKATASNGTLTVNICGIQTNPNKTVDIETETIAALDFAEKDIEDETLPMGTSKIIQKGKKGYRVKSYRVTKENGVEVERKLISTDTYFPVAQIRKVALTEVGFN